MGKRFTSRLIKGGAVLEDTRRVVERWDADIDPRANLESLSAENPLGKTSRSRLNDLLSYVIRAALRGSRRSRDPDTQGHGRRPSSVPGSLLL